MHRKCRNCLCRTCITVCGKCKGCERKVNFCENYTGFWQMNIFESMTRPKYRSAPRWSWKYYGITKKRYKELTGYIQSGRYAPLALQAARTANETIAEYILMSVIKNKSYEGLEKLWARGDMERIPYGKTDFYGYRRLFYHIFNQMIGG